MRRFTKVLPLIPSAITAAIMMASNATAISGQGATGKVSDATSGVPVALALVELLDSAGLVIRQTQSSTAGLFTIPTPAGARVRIRVQALGYETFLSSTFPRDEQGPMRIDAALKVSALQLASIGSASDRTCRIRESSSTILAVWTEARKALAGVVASSQNQTMLFHGFKFSRRVNRDSAVVGQTIEPFASGTRTPFVMPPVDSIMRGGYVQRIGSVYEYYAPTPELLLSSEFEDTHCFNLTRSSSYPGMIGVTFTPAPNRQMSDIAGTAWIDTRSHALRHIQFRYDNASSVPFADRASGYVELRVVPGSGWIVSRWRIVTAAVAEEDSRLNNRLGGIRVVEFLHEGGEVTAVTSAGARTALTRPGTILGVAYDSTRAAVLPGATIILTGTGIETRSNADGSFRIDNIPEGTYVVALSHPRLDSLPSYTHPGSTVTVASGSTAKTTVSIRPLSESVIGDCRPSTSGPRTIPAYGVVRDTTGKPLAGATVALSWKRYSGTSTLGRLFPGRRETTTDNRGRFVICEIDREQKVTIDVAAVSDTFSTLRESTRAPEFWDITPSRSAVAIAAPTAGIVDSLPRTAIELGPVTGTAVQRTNDNDLSAGYRLARPASRLTREQLNSAEKVGTSMRSALRQLSGIRMRDTRNGVCIESTRTGGSLRGQAACRPVGLIRDGISMGPDAAQLLLLNVSELESIEYLTPSEAGMRWPDMVNGAIVVWTKGFGPHRKPANSNDQEPSSL